MLLALLSQAEGIAAARDCDMRVGGQLEESGMEPSARRALSQDDNRRQPHKVNVNCLASAQQWAHKASSPPKPSRFTTIVANIVAEERFYCKTFQKKCFGAMNIISYITKQALYKV